MYTKIKQVADEAIALQNKDRMDKALREISCLCNPVGKVEQIEGLEAMMPAQQGHAVYDAPAKKGGAK